MSEHSSIDDAGDLERRVDRELRQLPPRTAPETLESRVLRELARLATAPWWRRSFGHWPTGARVSFLVACVALAGGTLVTGTWMWDGIRSLPEWLYACLAVAAFLYVLLFALGAAAYRTLYLHSAMKVIS